MAITAKISEPTHRTLKQMSEKTGKPMQLVLEEAVELYRREKFFEDLNRGVLALKENPQAWAEELKERRLLEGTLSDGLADEPAEEMDDES
jgi:predicted DNA-binding protein